MRYIFSTPPKTRLFSLFLCLTLNICLFITPSLSAIPKTPRCFTIGVPAYAYPNTPNDFWRLVSSAKPGTIYILNPASGPGSRIDPTYTAAILKAKRAGIKIFGYVDTNYGKRPLKVVIKDVDTFSTMYPITGVFFDQAGLDNKNLAYYTELSKATRLRKLSVAFNPGQADIDERYIAIAEHIMTFEGPMTTYTKVIFPKWSGRYPVSKFWHVVYDVPNDASMRQVISQARQRPVGLLYITNGTMPNPWSAAPPYWKQESTGLCPDKQP